MNELLTAFQQVANAAASAPLTLAQHQNVQECLKKLHDALFPKKE